MYSGYFKALVLGQRRIVEQLDDCQRVKPIDKHLDENCMEGKDE